MGRRSPGHASCPPFTGARTPAPPLTSPAAARAGIPAFRLAPGSPALVEGEGILAPSGISRLWGCESV